MSAATKGGGSLRGQGQSGAKRVDALNWALGIGAAFALSPVLVDLGRHWLESPVSRYSLVFVPLTLVWIAGGERSEARRASVFWVVAAILAAALLVAGGRTAWARVAIPVAIIGLCRARGLGSLRSASLAFFVVPMPALVSKWTSPALPELLSTAAGAGVGLVAEALEIANGVAQSGSERLELVYTDGGAALVFLFVGLGWARATAEPVSAAPGVGQRVRKLVWLPLVALAAQTGVWVVALGLLASSGAGAARSTLDHAPLAIGVVGAFWVGWAARKGSRAELS